MNTNGRIIGVGGWSVGPRPVRNEGNAARRVTSVDVDETWMFIEVPLESR